MIKSLKKWNDTDKKINGCFYRLLGRQFFYKEKLVHLEKKHGKILLLDMWGNIIGCRRI